MMRAIFALLVMSSIAHAQPCGGSPNDWCAAPPNDPCGAHHDVASCRADPKCYGMPYHGESVVACELDDRGFSSNCPTVGCTSKAPPPRRLPACDVGRLQLLVALDRETVRVNGKLNADVQVALHPGATACSIVEWSCGFDRNFSSTDPAIHADGIDCDKNVPLPREITPSKGLDHRFALTVGDRRTVGKHRFQLAFRPGERPGAAEVRSQQLQLEIQLR